MPDGLPGSWRLLSVDDIKADHQGAIAIGPFGSRMKSDLYTETGVPVIRGTNFSGSGSWKGDWVYVSDDTADSMPNCNVTAGDLVFPHRGAIGEVGIIPNDDIARYMMSTSLMKLTVSSKIADPRYVYYYFRSPQGRAEILSFSSQVGTPGIGQPLTSLKSCRIPLPQVKEQKAIADILWVIDDKIELNRRMNETLEAMARALFKSWFVDFDPVRAKLDGRQPAYMDEGTAALFPDGFCDDGVPIGWRKLDLKDEFSLTMGQSPPGETYNEEKDGLPFFQGRKDFGFRFPTNRIFCSAPNRIAEKGDTLVSVRAPVGAVNMAIERCCIGRGVAAVRHKSGSRSFTYYAVHNIGDQLQVHEAGGTVFGSITKRDFQQLEVVDPSSDLVEAFERKVWPLEEKIQMATYENQTLKSLRDLLLPRLMSGEVHVSVAEV
ncbi:restriction endonuclease subunit S [bacterium]|nr:restriction endonuclease subunit S [bacterium]